MYLCIPIFELSLRIKNRTNVYESRAMTNTGAHTHTISGTTADAGNATVNETRVFSYGVTWIIKI